MKQKKETLASKASALLADNPTMKPKEIAEKLGVPVQRIYVLRSNLKKKKLAKKIVSNVTTKKSYAGTNYILKLENEVSQYHKWCLEWREKYEKLEQDYANAKVMFLNSQAVVDYLENKVANLITISNLKGN
jgi:sugar-specific transcriptional regulator TrmB